MVLSNFTRFSLFFAKYFVTDCSAVFKNYTVTAFALGVSKIKSLVTWRKTFTLLTSQKTPIAATTSKWQIMVMINGKSGHCFYVTVCQKCCLLGICYLEFVICYLLFGCSTDNLGSLLMGKSHSRDADHCALLLNFDLKFTRSLVTKLTPSLWPSAQ